MRIIRGRYKGFRFPEFHGKNTRPSSELFKESLFNILEAYIEFEGLRVLDCFAGTGNIGIEFLSRGASKLMSIDKANANVRYMNRIKEKIGEAEWTILQKDALKVIENGISDTDLIFADPPYDYPEIHAFVSKVLESEWFRETGGIFILEHVDRLVFNDKHVILNKQYGNTAFTMFRFDKV